MLDWLTRNGASMVFRCFKSLASLSTCRPNATVFEFVLGVAELARRVTAELQQVRSDHHGSSCYRRRRHNLLRIEERSPQARTRTSSTASRLPVKATPSSVRSTTRKPSPKANAIHAALCGAGRNLQMILRKPRLFYVPILVILRCFKIAAPSAA